MTVPMAPSMLSAAAWRRLRAGTTAVLLVVATAGGVGLAVQAPATSPVAAAPNAAAAPDGGVPHHGAFPDRPGHGGPGDHSGRR